MKEGKDKRASEKEAKDVEVSFESLAGFLKKRWNIAVLLLILIFGFYIRFYHIDYPVIGYHNWKEARYLEEARNFANKGFFIHGFFVAEHDYPAMHADPSGAHGGEFPLLSIIIGVLFRIFGISLLMARAFVLILGLATIIMMYLLVKELFNREDIALSAALATAMMPMLVFFTHNVDVINLGLLLMVSGAYFYVLWVKHNKSRDMILASVLIMLAAISKYDFLVIGMPMLFIFPWKRLNELRRLSKKYVPYAISFLIFMLIPVQYFYFDYINRKANVGSISEEINFATIFSSEFWAAMKSYIPDNYTWWGFAIALFGVAFLLLFYQKNNLGYRFSLGYLVGLFIYTFIMSDKMKGHSYHQYSLAPFFAIMIAYCLVVVATNAANIVKIKQAKPLIIIALFLVLYFPSAEAWNRQFDTQFFGLDVAGEYIKNNSMPYERIIHSNHQDYGVLWYAERKGVDGYIPNASEIRWAEENLNVTWIFMYQWGLQTIKQPDEWNYIKQHYSLKQLALLNGQLFYMLFKKGGSFNESMLQNITAVPSVREYELTKGKVQMHYINFD